jgi:N6-L-threonylcarbamoyladenine synthase
MLVLGIESSCDETAAAVVEDGQRLLSNVIHSQIKTHTPYGGVVPELASREHLEKIRGIVDRAAVSNRERSSSLTDSGSRSNPPDRTTQECGVSLAMSRAATAARSMEDGWGAPFAISSRWARADPETRADACPVRAGSCAFR